MGVQRSTREFCSGTSCQKDYEWSLKWDDQHRRRPWSASQLADLAYIDEVQHAEGNIHFSAEESAVSSSMAEAELRMGECVIHKPHYEPSPARKGRVLDGSCDFDPEMFRGEDGSLPDWLAEFLAEFPRSGAAVGFSAPALRGSWMPWEQKPQTGLTLGVLDDG